MNRDIKQVNVMRVYVLGRMLAVLESCSTQIDATVYAQAQFEMFTNKEMEDIKQYLDEIEAITTEVRGLLF